MTRWCPSPVGTRAESQIPPPHQRRIPWRVRRCGTERDALAVLVIDVANVIGSRPTGWWRDRAGATRRLTEQVRATVTSGRLDPPVTLVLEGRARVGADVSDVDGVAVVHAPGEGDDTIAAIAEAHRGVVVVTADRRLADRVRASDAEVVGPSWLLDQLVD
jgi:hypothetical protein